MRLSENRKLATVVLIVCILASIILFGGGGLRNERYDILQVFSDGTDTSLSVRHSMEAYLQRCAGQANALAEQGVKLGADAALMRMCARRRKPPGRAERTSTAGIGLSELVPAVEALYTRWSRPTALTSCWTRAWPTTTSRARSTSSRTTSTR